MILNYKEVDILKVLDIPLIDIPVDMIEFLTGCETYLDVEELGEHMYSIDLFRASYKMPAHLKPLQEEILWLLDTHECSYVRFTKI